MRLKVADFFIWVQNTLRNSRVSDNEFYGMSPVRTMASLNASKRSAANVTASKIKNKILSPSFNKFSVMNNNKVLALGLQAQKQRFRQMEVEVVNLQKKLVAMSFERAAVSYKEKKLRLIFESLQSNTLNMYTYLNMVADMFTDGNLPKLPGDNLSGDVDKENLVVGSLSDQLPRQPEMASNVFNSHNSPRKSMDIFNDNTDAEKRHSRRFKQASQTGTYLPSSSLRDDVEKLSIMSSQSGLHMKSVPCLQNSQTSSAESMSAKPQQSLSSDAPSSSGMQTEPGHQNTQEKTMLLNATMEMTLSEDTEIITVETQAKKTGASSTGSLLQTDGHPLDEIRYPKPKTQCRRVFNTRIPKLRESEDGNPQKTAKDKLKSRHHTSSKARSHDTAMKASEGVELPTENDAARSNITCRRTSTKCSNASYVSQETFVSLPPLLPESERSPHKMEQLHNEVEAEVEACKDQELPEESLYVEQDLVASSGSPNCEAEELSAVMDAGDNLKHSESNPHRQSDGALVNQTSSSGQHPWLATLDAGGPQEDLRSNDGHEAAPLDQDCTSGTELPPPKKSRRQEMSETCENKAEQKKGQVDHLSDRKKKKKSSCCKKRFRCTDEDRYLKERGDASPLNVGVDAPERNKQLDDLRVVESHSDVCEKGDIVDHLNDGSVSRMARNPKQYRKTFKLQTPTETRNLRGTFVIYRRKTQDAVPLDDTGTSEVLESHTVDTSGEALLQDPGDRLMDEMPPWLDIDVSIADTEVGSPDSRRETSSSRRETSSSRRETSSSRRETSSSRRETSGRAALIEESTAVTTEASPARRVLTPLTNAITSPESENGRRTRKRKGAISYKEPSLNSKMRR